MDTQENIVAIGRYSDESAIALTFDFSARGIDPEVVEDIRTTVLGLCKKHDIPVVLRLVDDVIMPESGIAPESD